MEYINAQDILTSPGYVEEVINDVLHKISFLEKSPFTKTAQFRFRRTNLKPDFNNRLIQNFDEANKFRDNEVFLNEWNPNFHLTDTTQMPSALSEEVLNNMHSPKFWQNIDGVQQYLRTTPGGDASQVVKNMKPMTDFLSQMDSQLKNQNYSMLLFKMAKYSPAAVGIVKTALDDTRDLGLVDANNNPVKLTMRQLFNGEFQLASINELNTFKNDKNVLFLQNDTSFVNAIESFDNEINQAFSAKYSPIVQGLLNREARNRIGKLFIGIGLMSGAAWLYHLNQNAKTPNDIPSNIQNYDSSSLNPHINPNGAPAANSFNQQYIPDGSTTNPIAPNQNQIQKTFNYQGANDNDTAWTNNSPMLGKISKNSQFVKKADNTQAQTPAVTSNQSTPTNTSIKTPEQSSIQDNSEDIIQKAQNIPDISTLMNDINAILNQRNPLDGLMNYVEKLENPVKTFIETISTTLNPR